METLFAVHNLQKSRRKNIIAYVLKFWLWRRSDRILSQSQLFCCIIHESNGTLASSFTSFLSLIFKVVSSLKRY